MLLLGRPRGRLRYRARQLFVAGRRPPLNPFAFVHPSDAAFRLALLSVEGVGRVTAHRVLARFPNPDALAATPLEQVLVRLKGVPRAAAIAGRLTDRALVADAVERASAEVAALAGRRIETLTPAHAHWPVGLDALPAAQRPLVLWAYGNTAAVAGPVAAILGRTPLPEAPYESAQAFAGRLLAAGVAPALGLRPGFDVALHRLAAGTGRPAVAVASTGFAKVDGSVRPAATALVRAGGVMLSSFPMDHGPFDHDEYERALVQAAISRVVAAFAPQAGTPEERALVWAASAHRPAYFSGAAVDGLEGARNLDDEGAMDAAVGAAMR